MAQKPTADGGTTSQVDEARLGELEHRVTVAVTMESDRGSATISGEWLSYDKTYSWRRYRHRKIR